MKKHEDMVAEALERDYPGITEICKSIDNERIPLTPYIPIRAIPELLKGGPKVTFEDYEFMKACHIPEDKYHQYDVVDTKCSDGSMRRSARIKDEYARYRDDIREYNSLGLGQLLMGDSETFQQLKLHKKEKKMPINNMYESIYIIYDTLKSELDRQGVDDESINKVMDDLLESMNYNIKWKLKKD
jgi:hypothetical protein